MEKRWILIPGSYDGLVKTAVNLLNEQIASRLSYVLPVKTPDAVRAEELCAHNVILVGTASHPLFENLGLDIPEKREGYAITVGKSAFCEDAQMIVIAGYDDAGVLCGCADFIGRYLGDIVWRGGPICNIGYYDDPFSKQLNEWKVSTAPAVSTRAIWCWGHVIYDYRRFFDNMARLRLNEAVIWNDRIPFNAKDVVDYAHSRGVKVVWGFAWGWGTACADILAGYNEQFVKKLKEDVIRTYAEQYAATGCDGIYFQSFTELNDDYVNGLCIAEVVTDLVNEIAAALLARFPDLHIQFGLHATSVRTHLDHIKRVDPRVHIVWEDCGAFPYAYFADYFESFDETLALTEQFASLRGAEENVGVVFKGMSNLDWSRFEHFTESYILGEYSESFIKERQIAKEKIWRTVQAHWIKNAGYVRKTVQLLAKKSRNPIIEVLLEDGLLENEIPLCAAIYAEMLWSPDEPCDEIIERAMKNPYVKFANI